MKSASTNPGHEPVPALPEDPPNDVTGGVDWARDDHAVAVVDNKGRALARATVEHSTQGLRDLLRLLARHGVGEVAIERPDGPVVETLLNQPQAA